VESWASLTLPCTCVVVEAEAAEDAEVEGCADLDIGLAHCEGCSAYLEVHRELEAGLEELVAATLVVVETYRDQADGRGLVAVLVEWGHWTFVAQALVGHGSSSAGLDRSDLEAFHP
jgi:hypothetical protein